MDIMRCVDKIAHDVFSLDDLYSFEGEAFWQVCKGRKNEDYILYPENFLMSSLRSRLIDA